MSDKFLDMTMKKGNRWGLMGDNMRMLSITYNCKELAITECDRINTKYVFYRIVEIHLGV